MEDLGYDGVMIIAMYGEGLAHSICWFQEKDNSWNFFSSGVDIYGNNKFYYNAKRINPYYILNFYFPEWVKIHLCLEGGHIVKTIYRKD